MRKSKIRYTILLILLVAIPFSMLFSGIIIGGKGYEPVPDPHPENAWVWHVAEGDTLWFEFEYVEHDHHSKEVRHMFKNCFGFNITAFYNNTHYFPSPIDNSYYVSRVYAEQYWFNLTSGLAEPTGWSHNLAHFGFTPFRYPHELYYGGNLEFIPLLLPINGTSGTLDLEYLDDIIYNTYYYPLYDNGNLNNFDNYYSSNTENYIYFENTVDGYFINASYSSDGTLKEVEYFSLHYGWREVYLKVNRIFDPDITNGVEWDVDVGDVLYFGENNEYEGFVEQKVEIVGFDYQTFWGYWDFDHYSTKPMSFERVLADIYLWNPYTEMYVFHDASVPIGIANNYYPSLPWQTMMPEPFTPYISDKNGTLDEFEFMQNNFTARTYTNLDEFHFEVDGNLVHFKGANYTDLFEVWGISDMETGMVKVIKHSDGDHPEHGFTRFEKNMTVYSGGSVIHWLQSDIVKVWNAHINFTSFGDVELYWAVIPANPVNIYSPYSLPLGPAIYMDIYVNETAMINGPVQIVVDYDQAMLEMFGIDEIDLIPIAFNITEQEWGVVPKNFYILDTVNDRISINMPWLMFSLFSIGANSTSRVRWAAGVGDDLYYGGRWGEFKAVITAINETFIKEWGVFSEVYADIYKWELWSETWNFERSSVLIAAANNYWPMAPYYMHHNNTQGPPFLYPMGTTGYHFESLSFMFEEMYDDYYFDYNYTYAINYDDGTFNEVFLDVDTGFPLLTRGYRYVMRDQYWGEYEFYSSFKKFVKPLSGGANLIVLENNFFFNLTFIANVLTNAYGADFLYAILPQTPVPEEIPWAEPLFYCDLMITNHYLVNSISFEIYLPEDEFDLREMRLILFRWELHQYYYGDYYSVDEYWTEMSEDEIRVEIEYDYDSNSFIILLHTEDPLAGIYAVAYEHDWQHEKDGDFEGEIPGYEIILLIGIIGIVSIVLVKKRRDSISKNLRIK